MLYIKTESENKKTLRLADFIPVNISEENVVRAVFEAMNTPAARAAMNTVVRASENGEDADVVVEGEITNAANVVVGMLVGAGAEFANLDYDPALARHYAQFKMYQLDPDVASVDVAPVTDCLGGGEDDELLTVTNALRPKAIVTVIEWVHEGLTARATKNDKRSSYGLKHLLEAETGIYLTNNQFKHAMAVCGYEIAGSFGPNAQYRISEKSPAIVRAKKNART